MLFTEGTSLDTILHILTVLVALILFGISLMSYLTHKKVKFLYICLAFLVFAIKEALIMFDHLSKGDAVVIFISHALNFLVLGLFFAGVMRK